MKEYPARQLAGWHFLVLALLPCLAPLAGVMYLDLPLARYIEFPPTTKYIEHAPFSWTVFALLFLFVASVCLPLVYRFMTFKTVEERTETTYPFPWWGWFGVACILITWLIAWNRFPVFAPLQKYTFTPLWIGYILVVNALTFRRQGSCLLCSQSRYFLMLFPASALFWWYFEYLNRFVQNWYYRGGGEISAFEYIVHASICFSTVLPAVLSTNLFLGSFPRLAAPFAEWHYVRIPYGKEVGLILLALAFGSFAALVIMPDYLFPMVWISPLFVIVGIQLASGRKSILTYMEQGNWQHIIIPSLAALVCGFFWEMWNWKSLAHWEYSVPFVNRFQIFAMPFLGYAGYLPFGVVCTEAGALLKTNSLN